MGGRESPASVVAVKKKKKMRQEDKKWQKMDENL